MDERTTSSNRSDDDRSARVRAIESSVTSISWIPSEAVTGANKAMFSAAGPVHYDAPPPDRLGDLAGWRDADRFRFANHLRARVLVEDGPDGPRIVGAEYDGRSMIGSTTLQIGRRGITFAAVALEELRSAPEIGADRVRFEQTYGGRTGVPAPRHVNRAPFVQFRAPLVWTTLALTIHLDGTVEHEVVGASRFPRHWIYDQDGALVEKVGLADFKDWFRNSFGSHSPWGDEESPALVTEVETALERQLSARIMHGTTRPKVRTVGAGVDIVRQGEPGDELFLLLDGVVSVSVDGDVVAEVGPGAVLGERAAIEGDGRTATLRATTPCRLAVASAAQLDDAALAELSAGHRREELAG